MTTIKDIVRYTARDHGRYLGDEALLDTPVTGARPVSEAGASEVAFVGNTARDPGKLLGEARATLIIISEQFADIAPKREDRAYILVANARATFLRVVRDLFLPPIVPEISPTARIHPSARIGKECYIGDFCLIGAGVTLGDCCVVHSGVQIYAGATIGNNVTIYSGTVIGADGFGYERNDAGELEKFPHIGSIVIEDDVEIGANTCVDRGTLGNTFIGRGSKIDNLCHIAHNVRVGRNSMIIANAMIGGSTVIGDGCWVAPSACLRDGISIGNNATVGMAALVTKSVPDNAVVAGSPARDIGQHKALMAELGKLAEKPRNA